MSEISVTQKLLLALEDQRYIFLPSFVSDAITTQDMTLRFIHPTSQSFSPVFFMLEALMGDEHALQVCVKQYSPPLNEDLLGIQLADDGPELTNDLRFKLLLDRNPTRRSVFQGLSLYYIENGKESCPEHTRLIGEVIKNAGGAIKTMDLNTICDQDIESIFSKHDTIYIMEPSHADLKTIQEIILAKFKSDHHAVCIVSKGEIYLAVMSGSSTTIWGSSHDTPFFSKIFEEPKQAKRRKLKSDPENLGFKSVDHDGKKVYEEASTVNKFQLPEFCNAEPDLADLQKVQLSKTNHDIQHEYSTSSGVSQVQLPLYTLASSVLTSTEIQEIVGILDGLSLQYTASMVHHVESQSNVLHTGIRDSKKADIKNTGLFEIVKTWVIDRINENADGVKYSLIQTDLQAVRYQEGNFFAKHQDFANYVSNEFQCYTLIVNLGACKAGGETVLYIDENPITVRETAKSPGSALIFRKNIFHEGLPVLEGTKLILKADLIGWKYCSPKEHLMVLSLSSCSYRFLLPCHRLPRESAYFLSYQESLSKNAGQEIFYFEERVLTLQQVQLFVDRCVNQVQGFYDLVTSMDYLGYASDSDQFSKLLAFARSETDLFVSSLQDYYRLIPYLSDKNVLPVQQITISMDGGPSRIAWLGTGANRFLTCDFRSDLAVPIHSRSDSFYLEDFQPQFLFQIINRDVTGYIKAMAQGTKAALHFIAKQVLEMGIQRIDKEIGVLSEGKCLIESVVTSIEEIEPGEDSIRPLKEYLGSEIDPITQFIQERVFEGLKFKKLSGCTLKTEDSSDIGQDACKEMMDFIVELAQLGQSTGKDISLKRFKKNEAILAEHSDGKLVQVAAKLEGYKGFKSYDEWISAEWLPNDKTFQACLASGGSSKEFIDEMSKCHYVRSDFICHDNCLQGVGTSNSCIDDTSLGQTFQEFPKQSTHFRTNASCEQIVNSKHIETIKQALAATDLASKTGNGIAMFFCNDIEYECVNIICKVGFLRIKADPSNPGMPSMPVTVSELKLKEEYIDRFVQALEENGYDQLCCASSGDQMLSSDHFIDNRDLIIEAVSQLGNEIQSWWDFAQ